VYNIIIEIQKMRDPVTIHTLVKTRTTLTHKHTLLLLLLFLLRTLLCYIDTAKAVGVRFGILRKLRRRRRRRWRKGKQVQEFARARSRQNKRPAGTVRRKTEAFRLERTWLRGMKMARCGGWMVEAGETSITD